MSFAKHNLGIILLFTSLSFTWGQNHYELNTVQDVSLIASSLAMVGGCYLYDALVDEESMGQILNPTNAFDDLFLMPYNGDLDLGSDLLTFLSLGIPLGLPLVSSDDWFTLGVMYAEVAGLTQGSKELLKRLFRRTRPYALPGSELPEEQWGEDITDAFPSGHAAAVAASTMFLFHVLDQQDELPSRVKITLKTSAIAVAAASNFLRVYSGSHYMTDILAGTLVGGFIGWVIPHSHKRPDAPEIIPSAEGLTLSWRLVY